MKKELIDLFLNKSESKNVTHCMKNFSFKGEKLNFSICKEEIKVNRKQFNVFDFILKLLFKIFKIIQT